MPLKFDVVAEEIIGTFENPDNGSGPMWCYGSPTIVRNNDRVFAAIPETDKDAKPLCNTRRRIFCRGADGKWELVYRADKTDEREPCPLVTLPGGRLIMSVNPAVSPRPAWGDGRIPHNCRPHLLEFSVLDPKQPPSQSMPVWAKEYEFTEHSYRGVAADHHTGEILLLNVIGYDGQTWTMRDSAGQWVKQGYVGFPLRGAYPHLALRKGAAFMMAVSDVVEPNVEWRAHKRKVTGQEWDYDFRQLYFTWTPDIREHEFSPPLTVASRDETCGSIRNMDMWIAPDGAAHLVYIDRNVWHKFIRDEFFPGVPISAELKYCVIEKGKVILRRTIARSIEGMFDEGKPRPTPTDIPDSKVPLLGFGPGYAALHATADDRLILLCHAGCSDPKQPGAGGVYAMQLHPAAEDAPVKLDMKFPLGSFFTATVRNGTMPSDTIDLYGHGPEPNTIRYAQIKVTQQ
ncbi:MAG TPA: hypothetical protein PL033_09170 [Candidatus Brocadiia bacterium]|nr:hypothetical protein [Candidatus Brocadiia bacterium]